MKKKTHISSTRRWFRLVFAKPTPGVCRVCGCTETAPCFNPYYGSCWWADENETVCSHCYHKKIFQDPDTIHCVRTGQK